MPRLTTEASTASTQLKDWCRNLRSGSTHWTTYRASYRVSVGSLAAGGHRIDLQRLEHGLSSEKHIPREFFESAEYLRIADLGRP